MYRCLNVEERERWSAYQLLQHSFIKQQVPSCVVRNEDRITSSAGGENALATKTNEPEEPIPDICYFSCVSGKSRLHDFEQLQFLGKGGFGNVIKVNNLWCAFGCFVLRADFEFSIAISFLFLPASLLPSFLTYFIPSFIHTYIQT